MPRPAERLTHRIARRCARAAFAAGLVVACAVAAGADDVARYLESKGLTTLLATHLEDQLETAEDDEREALIMQLAGVYADILETNPPAAQRTRLEERGRALLSELPPRSEMRMRLDLTLRWGAYRSAERIAEDHRLRLADDESLARAVETLAELRRPAAMLRETARAEAETARRAVQRADRRQGRRLSRRVRAYESLANQAAFLEAWVLYYGGWLDNDRGRLIAARDQFARLLDIDGPLDPTLVTVDLRDVEYIARSILGVALCQSQLDRDIREADRWLDLLLFPETHPAIRSQVPVWRIVVALEHQEFARALELLNAAEAAAERGESPRPPLNWIRLMVVHAIEHPDDAAARRLISRGVTEFASRGELGQVLDLAERYGVDTLGDRNFALHYIDGVMAWQTARDAHGDEEPAADPVLIAAYERAREDLQTALRQPDVREHPDAAAACRRLIAWCTYFTGDFLRAADEFIRAEDELRRRDEQADALWMAIVCLDRLDQAKDPRASESRLTALIEEFLQKHPRDEHAPTLVLRRAHRVNEPSEQFVAELLAVPRASDAYDAARRRAASMLYALFTEASEPDRRAELGPRYLEVVTPMLLEDVRQVEDDAVTTTERFGFDVRRALDVALDSAVADLKLANLVFDAFDTGLERAPATLAQHRDDVDYQRVRARLLANDPSAADVIADALWRRDPTSEPARAAARAVFRHAEEKRRLDLDAGADNRLSVDLVVRHARRLLEEYADEAAALEDPRIRLIHSSLAAALMQRWERTRNEAEGREALALYQTVLEREPRRRDALRAVGLLGGAYGAPDAALAAWRTLLAGLRANTEPWYEAKLNLIRILAEVDRPRAAAVMEQYMALHTDGGPPRWRQQFLKLNLDLRSSADEPAAEGGADE